jgi:hypothetical protein
MLLLLRISHYRILSNYDSYSIIVRIEIVESAIATELDMISFISDDIVKRGAIVLSCYSHFWRLKVLGAYELPSYNWLGRLNGCFLESIELKSISS